MKGENAVYFYVKCVEAMVYSKDVSLILNDLDSYFEIDPIVLYNILELFIRGNINNLDKQSKENVYEIVNHYKSKVNENMINKINNIVRLANNSNCSKIKLFIKNEYDCRFLDTKTTYNALRDLNLALDSLKDMFLADFNILINHSSFYDDESFEPIIDTYINNDIFYIGCINAIVGENPELLKDKLFVSRIRQVISRMSIKNKNIKRIYSKFKKNIGI